jgi:carboxypeptidase family protein
MKSSVVTGLAVIALVLGWVGQGSCAQVVGTVKDVAGKPVQGVKILAVDKSGTMAGQALSAANGTYVINGLTPDKYVFKLDPQGTGFQAGNGVAYLGSEGLTVDWTVSRNAMALDDAAVGTGLSASTVIDSLLTPAGIPVVGGVVAGAVLGGLGAAGSLGTTGSTTPSL